jgi:MscS family membrane protein
MLEIILHNALFVSLVLFTTLMGNRIINMLLDIYYCKVAKRTLTKFDDEILPLVKRLFNLGIWASGLCVIALNFGMNVTGLYAGLGISSLVIAMIVKESSSNIIAGITIMFDRPFKVGDQIKLPSGDFGYVLDIGLRRTRIEIHSDEQKIGPQSILVITNKDISKCKIYNYTLLQELQDEQET